MIKINLGRIPRSKESLQQEWFSREAIDSVSDCRAELKKNPSQGERSIFEAAIVNNVVDAQVSQLTKKRQGFSAKELRQIVR